MSKPIDTETLDYELIAKIAVDSAMWGAQVATLVRKAKRARAKYLRHDDAYHLGAWQALGSLLVEYGASPEDVELAISGPKED